MRLSLCIAYAQVYEYMTYERMCVFYQLTQSVILVCAKGLWEEFMVGLEDLK